MTRFVSMEILWRPFLPARKSRKRSWACAVILPLCRLRALLEPATKMAAGSRIRRFVTSRLPQTQCTTTTIMQWLFRVISSSVWFSLVASLSDIKYSNRWSVQIVGGKEEADRLARKHDFVNEGKVSLMHITCFVLFAIHMSRKRIYLPHSQLLKASHISDQCVKAINYLLGCISLCRTWSD